MQFPQILALSALTLGGLGGLLMALRAQRRARLIQHLPTSKTRGVFIGLVELEGRAQSDAPFVSFLAGIDCVHHSWSVDEHWRRTVTESYQDSKGRSRTRTRVESGTTSVASGGESGPFTLIDDEGAIRVLPEGAKLEPKTVFSRTVERGDPLYYAKGPPGAVGNSTGLRDFTERAIPLDSELFVVGRARLREDLAEPEIAADSIGDPYLISTRSQAQILASYRRGAWIWGLLGLACALGLAGAAQAFLQQGQDPPQQPGPYLLAAVSYALVFAVAAIWRLFNDLVDLQNRVERALAEIEVQLGRRADLIPRLVEVVAALSDHERLLETHLARLRAEARSTLPGDPGPDPQSVEPTLRLIREAVPSLSVNPAFLDLQERLIDTENRLALARGYYNTIAAEQLTRHQRFPDRLLTPGLTRRARPLLGAPDLPPGAPGVELDRPLGD